MRLEKSVCGNRRYHRRSRCRTMPDFVQRSALPVPGTGPRRLSPAQRVRTSTKMQAMADIIAIAMRIAIPARRGIFTRRPHRMNAASPSHFGLRSCRIDTRPVTERKMRWRDSDRRNRRERTGARCRVRGADVCPTRRKRPHRYRTRLRQTARKCRPREGP